MDESLQQDTESLPYKYELAGIGKRFVAQIIDLFILILLAIVPVLIEGNPDTFTVFVVYFGYNWYYWTRKEGQTPGKKLMDIRVVKVDGSSFNSTDVLLRTLGYSVSGTFLLIGYLYAFFDDDNQAWHDKIAGTYVIVSAKKKQKTVTI